MRLGKDKMVSDTASLRSSHPPDVRPRKDKPKREATLAYKDKNGGIHPSLVSAVRADLLDLLMGNSHAGPDAGPEVKSAIENIAAGMTSIQNRQAFIDLIKETM